MNRIIPFLFILLSTVSGFSQKTSDPFKIVFYNTENIFDTIDDPLKSDEDFLPGSKVPWTSDRYRKKLQQIARVLTSIDKATLPAVIGMAEVENIGVLNDLISTTSLNTGKYRALLDEGNDPRGIDVALIFRTDLLQYIGHKSFPSATSFQTRSILYVKLADKQQNTYHLFVNHWKSREGKTDITEQKRIENATNLKKLTDSVLRIDPKAYVVIMGDFNDEPSNKSIAEILNAKQIGKKIESTSLYNLMYDRFLKGEGTLYYKDWDVFDQIMVSGNLLTGRKKGKPVIRAPYCEIFKEDWMLYKNKSGDMVPNRTAGSKEYFGGFSDHLPVYTEIKY